MFTSDSVERCAIERLIEVVIWAPSSGNAQTWQFAVVTNPDRIRRMISPGLLGGQPAETPALPKRDEEEVSFEVYGERNG